MKIKLKVLTTILLSPVIIVLFSSNSTKLSSKEIRGAWGYGPADNRTVMINTENIFSVANYDVSGRKFISSYGGIWRLEGNRLIKKIEWNSKDTLQVGREIVEEVEVKDGNLINKQTNEKWNRLDDGTPGRLMGAWVITGNFSGDKATKRSNPFYPRRTMKVLSGRYFHWIAYNMATKSFMNAGGGTYTTVNGKYTENIEFFTKTAESVGKTLAFDFSFVNGDWRHKGQKSTGGAMDECWSPRQNLEN